MERNNVLDAGLSLSEKLKELGAEVYLGILPEISGKEKTGADDFLVEKGPQPFKEWLDSLRTFTHPELYGLDILLDEMPPDTPKEELGFSLKPLLQRIAKLEKGLGEQYLTNRIKDYFNLNRKDLDNLQILLKELRKQPNNQNTSQGNTPCPYFVDKDGYLCRNKPTTQGTVPVRLANFEAWISEENVEDNGVDLSHNYIIEGKMKGRDLFKIEVPATSFSSMSWPHKWGSQVILEPGFTTKDYVRHAIQTRSRPQKSVTYTHTGWREINGKWVYLTCGGAIGGGNILVKLPHELQRYSLPLIPENESAAIKASLSFLDIGKREITFPLFGLLYLTPLTTLLSPLPNFSGYLYGDTGVFKTTLALLLLSHFGNFTSLANLSNFEDTANALGKRGFTLKDCLMVLDDYHPSNRKFDAQQSESIAQKLIRFFSNRTGRGRLHADTTEKGRYEPRGMLLIIGEEIVALQSTVARISVVEVSKGDISINKLTRLQENSYLLPHAMTSYILWLRDNIEDIRGTFPREFARLRMKVATENKGLHPKLSEQVAFLQFALDTVLSWLADKGVIWDEMARDMTQEGWQIFVDLGKRQSRRLEIEDPVRMFDEILQTLIKQEKVRIEHRENDSWAYLLGGGEESELIGYYDEEFFYLLPTAFWHSITRYYISEGTHFPVSKNTLYKMLRDRGRLVPSKNRENTMSVRIRGNTERVLKIIRDTNSEKEDMEDMEEEVEF